MTAVVATLIWTSLESRKFTTRALGATKLQGYPGHVTCADPLPSALTQTLPRRSSADSV
jgi:hypothetical protein